MGNVENEFIIDFYKKESVNLFMHVSETEGLGMAIIEAQSFGIPAICCAAGGVKEVISKNSGILLEVETTPEKIANTILEFIDSEMNTDEFKTTTRNHFQQNFSIKNNIKKFIKIIEN